MTQLPAPTQTRRRRILQHRPHRPLSLAKRLMLWTGGWVLVLVGVAGLVLPGIHGVLVLLLAAAVLSLVSEAAYEMLRKSFGRWPKGWRRVLRLRRWMHRKLHPKETVQEANEREGKEPPAAAPPVDAGGDAP